MLMRLALRQIGHNKFESLLVVLQLAVTVFLVAIVGTYFGYLRFVKESVHETHFDQFSMYQSKGKGLAFDADRLNRMTPEEKAAYLKQLQQPGEKPQLHRVESRMILPRFAEGNPTMYLLDRTLAEETVLPLSKGEWFDVNADYGDASPAIVSNSLAKTVRLGETCKVPLDNDEKTVMVVKVIGVLEKGDFAYDNSFPPLNKGLLKWGFHGMIVYQEENALPPAHDIQGLGLGADWGYVQGVIREETDDHTATPMTDLLNGFLVRENKTIASLAMIGAIVIGLALTGIGCSVLLKAGRDTKRYAVMSFCGAQWRDCVRIEALKSLLIFLTATGPLTIYALGFLTRQKLFMLDVPLSAGAYLFGLLAALVLYVATAAWKVYHIARRNPVDVIKED